MKFEIAKKFLAGGAGGPSEQNSTVRLQAEGRQLRVDRESATLFAMKYAIGEILFLGVRCGMTFRPGTSMPRTTAESPSEVSHEVCDWQKLFSRPSLRCTRVVGSETAPAARSFPGPCRGNMLRLAMKDSIGQKSCNYRECLVDAFF